MATAQQVETIIRASEPEFRNKHDQLAFAVHAYLIADGYKLIATGKNADVPDEEIPEDKKRSSVKGWNQMKDCYAFRYVDPTGKRNPIMVKMVPLEDHLLLQWMAPQSFKEPRMLDLSVSDYVEEPSTTAVDDPAAGYKNLPDLVAKLRRTFHGHAAEAAAKQQPAATVTEATAAAVLPAAAASSLRAGASEPPFYRPGPEIDDDVLREGPRNAGPRTGGIPPVPDIGTGDLHPPMPGIPRGFPGPDSDPFRGGMGGQPGGIGGMYVGPDDPIFSGRFPGRGGMPGMGGDFEPGFSGRGGSGSSFPGSVPPGSRYDPIGPPGVPGFHPEDFQRQARRDPGRGDVHPDIMPPGPGRFDDSMFG